MVDFGAEESFYDAAIRMQEHHGIDIPVSTLRSFTESHASRARELDTGPNVLHPNEIMRAEMDGEMVPIVEYEDSQDRRKTKKNVWAELRLGVVQNYGQTPYGYASSFKNAEDLGDQMIKLTKFMGYRTGTSMYGVGDGAKWIVEQGERIAGSNFHFTIDLFHLCEYLSEAASAWTESVREETKHLKKQFQDGKHSEVLNQLKQHLSNHPNHKGLKDCIRYIENRPGQFNYKYLIENGLPVGSGKVESTHRSLMQKRLKKPGTWWLRENAEKMADLRTLRGNGNWRLLWQANVDETKAYEAA